MRNKKHIVYSLKERMLFVSILLCNAFCHPHLIDYPHGASQWYMVGGTFKLYVSHCACCE